jgi:hypothetical protein
MTALGRFGLVAAITAAKNSEYAQDLEFDCTEAPCNAPFCYEYPFANVGAEYADDWHTTAGFHGHYESGIGYVPECELFEDTSICSLELVMTDSSTADWDHWAVTIDASGLDEGVVTVNIKNGPSIMETHIINVDGIYEYSGENDTPGTFNIEITANDAEGGALVEYVLISGIGETPFSGESCL